MPPENRFRALCHKAIYNTYTETGLMIVILANTLVMFFVRMLYQPACIKMAWSCMQPCMYMP